MALESKNEFPAQTKNRRQWILDAVSANQSDVAALLFWVGYRGKSRLSWQHKAAQIVMGMHKMDRDAILQPGGILTDDQLEAIRDEMREMPAVIRSESAQAPAMGNGQGHDDSEASVLVQRMYDFGDTASKAKIDELRERKFTHRQILVFMKHWHEGLTRSK
jgi:hypothetical protein